MKCNRPKGHLPPHEHVLFDYTNPCGVTIGEQDSPMTDNTQPQTWQKSENEYGDPFGSGTARVWVEGRGTQGFYVSPDLPEWFVDSIIADHAAATKLADAERELIEQAATFLKMQETSEKQWRKEVADAYAERDEASRQYVRENREKQAANGEVIRLKRSCCSATTRP